MQKHITTLTILFLALSALTCTQKMEFNNPLDPDVELKAPSELVITNMTETSISLQWKNNITFTNSDQQNSFSIEIEQSANSGTYTLIKTVGANVTTATITAVFNSATTYSFRVRAVTSINKSLYSNTTSYNIAAAAGMVPVTGGTFTLGSENNLDYGASPSHSVTLSDFSISTTEIRWGMWDSVATWGKSNGYTDLAAGRKGYNGDATHPVTNVNWYDIVKWCNARSQKEGFTPVYYTSASFIPANIYKTGNSDVQNTMVNWSANGYRLPTEAEWEYAAQGGSKRQNPPYTYSGSNTLDGIAWYSTNSGNNTHQVGTKTANELGLYDMSGNVWEWCWDWYGTYSSSAQINPYGATTGTGRVFRGGSFVNNDSNCRVANRVSNFGLFSAVVRYNFIGFRVMRTKN